MAKTIQREPRVCDRDGQRESPLVQAWYLTPAKNLYSAVMPLSSRFRGALYDLTVTVKNAVKKRRFKPVFEGG